MKNWIQYRLMQAGEEQEICALVIRVLMNLSLTNTRMRIYKSF